MRIHLVVSRAYFRGYDQLEKFTSRVERAGRVAGWTATQKFGLGDFALFYFTQIKSIVGVGVVASELDTVTGPYQWTDWNGELTVCDYNPVWLLENPLRIREIVSSPVLQQWHRKKPYRRSHEIPADVAQALLTEMIKLNPSIRPSIQKLGLGSTVVNKHMRGPTGFQRFQEGGLQEITVELAKRNPQLRARAIMEYGYTCDICGFNFERFYGDLGSGYIEVHHLRPLSRRKNRRVVTVKEVRVVCANCHRVLHRNGHKPLSVGTLRTAIRRQKHRG